MLDGRNDRPNKQEIIAGLRESLSSPVFDHRVYNWIALAAKFLDEECNNEEWSDQQ